MKNILGEENGNLESIPKSNSRRSFLTAGTVLAVGGLLSACGAGDNTTEEDNTMEELDLALRILPEYANDETDFVNKVTEGIKRETGQTQIPLNVPREIYIEVGLPTGAGVGRDFQPGFGVKRTGENQFQLGSYINATHMNSDNALPTGDRFLPPNKNAF